MTQADARAFCTQLAASIRGEPQADDPRSAHQRNAPGVWD